MRYLSVSSTKPYQLQGDRYINKGGQRYSSQKVGGVPLTFLEAKRENSEKQSFHISPVPLFLLKNKNNLKFISRFINSFYFCTVIQYLRKYDKRGKGAILA